MDLSMWDYGLILIFILLLYIYGTRGLDRFEKQQIKCVKPLPFFGNTFKTIFGFEHFISFMNKIYNAFPNEKYIGFYDFRTPSIWLRDKDIIKQVLVKDFDHFVNHRNILPDNIDPLFSNNLFALKDQKWRDMRSTLSPAFTSSKMRMMYPLIIECAEGLSNFLEEEVNNFNAEGKDCLEIEVKDFFTRYANDVIATSAFGIKVDSLKDKNNEFFTMGRKTTNFSSWLFIKFLAYSAFPKLMKFFKVSLMNQGVADFFRHLVHQNMHLRETKGIVRPDMIHLLMQAKKGVLNDEETKTLSDDAKSKDHLHTNTTKRIWSDDELTSQAFLFFVAGFETASTFLAYAAYEIATRPEIQNKLRIEIDEVKKIHEKFTYDILLKMKYLDMFISETLRFWPPAIAIDRVCVKPYKLPPPNENVNTHYQVNIGEVLLVPLRSIHMDPKYFSDPDKFIPERFSDENKESIDPFAYLPFGGGPRVCLGSRFAQMEIKAAIVNILSKFEITPCSKTEDPLKAKMKAFRVIPDNGIWVGLKRRRNI